jgi:NitT/TauT family transport system permease protein
VVGLGFLAWHGMEVLSAIQTRNRFTIQVLNLAIPALFGAWLFFLWEVLTTGFSVPQVLLPAPSQIGEAFVNAGKTLAADFHQTFVRAVIPGFLIGSTAGFITAIAADRVPFLKRGLLPLGNLISAIPIVGIAPVMVMWFGFDWQSKAAVVTIMTFFPMLVNTLTGLAESSRIERDLLLTYASGYWRELISLRLPNAMPFIFNALKINSTLAMIGAIVAEFFGTPIVGMGFRISTEVGRMNIDMVWATIAVAALAGSMFYGLFAVMERVLTFWHPSMRKR